MADQSRKGLWERVKDVLGVPDEDEDLESRPRIASTFTASRLPSSEGGGSMPDTLFPESQGKWELYEDAWSDLDQRTRPADGPPPLPEPQLPEPPSPPEPPPALAARPPSEPTPAPAAQAPGSVTGPLDADDAVAHPAAAVDLPAPPAADDDLSTLESLSRAESPTDVLSHLDDAEVDALARAVGLEEHPPPPDDEPPGVAVEERPQEPLAWRPTPDLDAVMPKGGAGLFAEPQQQVRHRLAGSPPRPSPSSEPDGAPTVRAPDPIQHDTGAERRIEVYEQRLEAAATRARATSAPQVQVHDDRLDQPAPPQVMNPSEAVALAERGRSARGPREDVAPAS